MTDHSDDRNGAVGTLDEADLEKFFEAARVDAPKPDAALMARVAADALAEMPTAPAVRRVRRAGLGTRIAAWSERVMWPAGLSAAALVGLWVGISISPQMLFLAEGLVGTDIGYAMAGAFPSVDFVGGGY